MNGLEFVLAATLTLWVGLLVYMWRIDVRLKQLERRQDQ
ncbi:MAG TPA: hypothetical protein DEQ28_07005 [Clostridiales bacterium]|nr:hypothetical protein [Clostridiales bacterium]